MFSLLTLPPYQLLFVSEIMIDYFSLTSNNLCIRNLLHVIYLLVFSDSPPPSLFCALILCVLYHIWTTSSLPFSSRFLGVHANVALWVDVGPLQFYPWILHHDKPWGHNTHCSPTVNWHQVMLWKAPVPIWVHTAIPSQAISTQKVKNTQLMQVLLSVPSVKNLFFMMWCSW